MMQPKQKEDIIQLLNDLINVRNNYERNQKTINDFEQQQTIIQILESIEDLDSKNEIINAENSLLLAALSANYLDVAIYLLQHNANITVEDDSGINAIQMLAMINFHKPEVLLNKTENITKIKQLLGLMQQTNPAYFANTINKPRNNKYGISTSTPLSKVVAYCNDDPELLENLANIWKEYGARLSVGIEKATTGKEYFGYLLTQGSKFNLRSKQYLETIKKVFLDELREPVNANHLNRLNDYINNYYIYAIENNDLPKIEELKTLLPSNSQLQQQLKTETKSNLLGKFLVKLFQQNQNLNLRSTNERPMEQGVLDNTIESMIMVIKLLLNYGADPKSAVCITSVTIGSTVIPAHTNLIDFIKHIQDIISKLKEQVITTDKKQIVINKLEGLVTFIEKQQQPNNEKKRKLTEIIDLVDDDIEGNKQRIAPNNNLT